MKNICAATTMLKLYDVTTHDAHNVEGLGGLGIQRTIGRKPEAAPKLRSDLSGEKLYPKLNTKRRYLFCC